MKLQFTSTNLLSEEVQKELCDFAQKIGGAETVTVTLKEGENLYQRKGNDFTVIAKNKGAMMRGFLHLFRNSGDFSVQEQLTFEDFGLMLDCSRNAVYAMDAVKRLIRIGALLGYNFLHLYTEDTYEVNDEPYFGYMRGRYTKEEIKELDAYAQSYGVELVPCIQTLAHLNSIFRWPAYAPINDTRDILLLEDERTYQLIEHMFQTLTECFTSRRVNVGMDEAELIGRGKYFDIHGPRSRFEIMRKHVAKVMEIAAKYGFQCMMWSDMYFKFAFGSYRDHEATEIDEEFKNSVPDGITLIYWDYRTDNVPKYDRIMSLHAQTGNPYAFAGGLWTWNGFAPNNAFSLKTTVPAIESCVKNKVKTVMITLWGDDGAECAVFSIFASLCHAAEIAFGGGEQEARADVKALTGLDYDDFMAMDALDTVTEKGEGVYPPNPSKYLLYNDVLRGVLDSTLCGGENEKYSKIAHRLAVGEKNEDWGYLFTYMRALADVLSIKAELGLTVRNIYAAENRKAMKVVVKKTLPLLSKRLDALYEAARNAWMTEKKPHGFDVQDLRLGGLICRIKNVTRLLADWANGKTEKVAELEEKRLDYCGGGEEFQKKAVMLNYHIYNVTPNITYHI